MSELVIAPTSATTEGTGTSHSPYIVATDVVGDTTSGTSASAWVDGLDTSYVKGDAGRSSKGNYPLWSTVSGAPDASQVTAIGIRFRAMTPSSDPAAYIIPQLFGQTSKLLSNPFYGGVAPLQFAATDAWQDFDYVVSATEYDETGWAPDGVQSALEQTFIYARVKPSDVTGEFTATGVVYVAEQRIVLYYGVDLPCDTWVDLDLSTAVILEDGSGNATGIYGDGVIYGNEVAGTALYPDLSFTGVDLDPAKPYLVESTYDPSSGHDFGGRGRIISAFRPGHAQEDLDAGGAFGNLYSGFLGSTADTLQVKVGPGIEDWDDATYGVAQGYTTLAFQSDRIGALSAVRIRKLCTFGIPPLRLTNRDDRGRLTNRRSRQGGNRLTGYL